MLFSVFATLLQLSGANEDLEDNFPSRRWLQFSTTFRIATRQSTPDDISKPGGLSHMPLSRCFELSQGRIERVHVKTGKYRVPMIEKQCESGHVRDVQSDVQDECRGYVAVMEFWVSDGQRGCG
ncbi:hypothetical protein PM082_014474 [Marasmius tenuissimus]|nr:hypothetical protein PM082_014474 [Marasmius tenuissimus]